jgi:hypothetical protein
MYPMLGLYWEELSIINDSSSVNSTMLDGLSFISTISDELILNSVILEK